MERHGDDIEAMFKYREVIQLYPEHADANYYLARLLSLRFVRGDFVASGDHSQIMTIKAQAPETPRFYVHSQFLLCLLL